MEKHAATCPHCKATFDLSHGLDAINLTLATDYNKPDFTENGWRFFFRDYLPSYENTILVGCALAWNLDRPGVYYGCIPGGEPFRYKRGEIFPRPYGYLSLQDYIQHGIEPFLLGKQDAMWKLMEFVKANEPNESVSTQ